MDKAEVPMIELGKSHEALRTALLHAHEENAKLTNYIHEIRPKSDCYDRICQKLSIDSNISGYIDNIEHQRSAAESRLSALTQQVERVKE